MTVLTKVLSLIVIANPRFYELAQPEQGLLVAGNVVLPVTNVTEHDGKLIAMIEPFAFKDKYQLVTTYGNLRKAGLEVFYGLCLVDPENCRQYKITQSIPEVQDTAFSNFCDKIHYNASTYGIDITRSAVIAPLLAKLIDPKGFTWYGTVMFAVVELSYNKTIQTVAGTMAVTPALLDTTNIKQRAKNSMIYLVAFSGLFYISKQVMPANQRNAALLQTHEVLPKPLTPVDWWSAVSRLPPETFAQKVLRKLKKFA